MEHHNTGHAQLGELPLAPVELHAVYIQTEGWIVAWLEEIPGAVTQGATLAEARTNLRDALRELLAAQRDDMRDEAEGQTVVHRETLMIG